MKNVLQVGALPHFSVEVSHETLESPCKKYILQMSVKDDLVVALLNAAVDVQRFSWRYLNEFSSFAFVLDRVI